ncbi:MAG: DUF2163 domain-containing protein [Alphaproteobacteria bacterium]
MKTISPFLLQHLQGCVTTLATCFKITRLDGVVFGFTSWDRPLMLDGLSYQPTESLVGSALESTADLTPDNLDIQGALNHDVLDAADLMSGVYDGASVDVFRVNYQDLPSSLTDTRILWLRRAVIATVSFENGRFVAELRGLTEKLKKAHLDLYSPTCRARRLGDWSCGISLSSHQNTHTVTVVHDGRRFSASNAKADDYYRFGIVRWTSGPNAGREFVVKGYTAGQFTLAFAPPFAVAVGNTFVATRGCDRQFSTCRDVFNNVKNFRGDPPHLLPGEDKIRTL